jgi:tRNA A37 methylthiotransferase MiaB
MLLRRLHGPFRCQRAPIREENMLTFTCASGEQCVSAFISIMRGCNNMCAYCVVPYVRGAERSRDPGTIVREAKEAFEKGYRE